MENAKELLRLAETVQNVANSISGSQTSISDEAYYSVCRDLAEAVSSVSDGLYGIPSDLTVNTIRLLEMQARHSDFPEQKDLSESLRSWSTEVISDIRRINGHFIIMDQEFDRLMLSAERCSEEMLLDRVINTFSDYTKDKPELRKFLIRFYAGYSHLWGDFDPDAGVYDHFSLAIRALKEHLADVRWLYGELADYRSKKNLYGIVRFWVELDFDYINTLKEWNFDDYFDLDILKDRFSSESVFVDCGGYTGDTLRLLFKNYMPCRKIYFYDMIPANIRIAQELSAAYPQIIYRNAGVGSPEQAGKTITVQDMSTSSAALINDFEALDLKLRDIPDAEVELVTLDEDIPEPFSFLKMDIEGSEINALAGARRHITEEHPILAICSYHHYEHLWEIPRMIRSMDPDYKLYLRYNGQLNSWMTSEHYFLAV